MCICDVDPEDRLVFYCDSHSMKKYLSRNKRVDHQFSVQNYSLKPKIPLTSFANFKDFPSLPLTSIRLSPMATLPALD